MFSPFPAKLALRRSLWLGLAVTGLLLLAPSDAPAQFADASAGNVKFVATGTAGMHIEGKTQEVKVAEDSGTVVVSVSLGKLETGIGLRDSHMRDKYLEIGKFPTSELRVARGSIKLPGPGTELEADGTGSLTLHGTTKPVTFHYKAKHQADYVVSSTMHINMNDFGIVVPSYLGIKVKPDVDIDIQFHAVDR